MPPDRLVSGGICGLVAVIDFDEFVYESTACHCKGYLPLLFVGVRAVV